MKRFGWWGKLLEIDLNQRKTKVREISPEEMKIYSGGSGLAARILFDEFDDYDPLSEEAPILFMAGLLTGTPVPSASRSTVCARSPLTGIWDESNVGGYWGAELKSAGWDGILVQGISKNPVYLYITDDGVEIRNASDLWGKDTFETEDSIRALTDAKAKVASIGPAGEKKILISAIMFDGKLGRAAGRGGMGAVMGSKNLKAIAVRGHQRVPVHDLSALKLLLKTEIPVIREKAAGMTKLGTAGGVQAVEAWGDLPIKNWRLGSWEEGAIKTTAQTWLPKTLASHHTCYGCPIRCSKLIRLDTGPYAGIYGHFPEYETLAGFGGNCLNDDVEVIMAANDLCNRYGLDTISASAGVAFAMELYEKGIISTSDTDGLEVLWGDANSILTLTRQMAEGKGFGKILGEGTRNAALKIGKNTIEYSIQVKGLEFAFHDPRAFTSMAANYATENRGACHLGALTYFLGRGIKVPDLGYTEPPDALSNEGKGKIAYDMQNYMSIFNPMGLCKFLFLASVGPTQIAGWVRAVTGWDVSGDELMEMGQRLFSLKRMYNVRLGISRKDDTLPPRLMDHARPSGKSQGSLPHLGKMLDEYYKLRGWSEEGIPAPKTLEKLGLGWTKDALPITV
jgi:aldehyde:ferredoxin oxidoreductase